MRVIRQILLQCVTATAYCRASISPRKRSLDRRRLLGIERVSLLPEVNRCETGTIQTQIYRFRRSIGCSFRFSYGTTQQHWFCVDACRGVAVGGDPEVFEG
jgi:hypothetical protein